MSPVERLERLRNRATLYELAAIHPDGRKLLIRYSQSRSRGALYRCLTKDAERICAVLGADDVTFAKRSQDGATMGAWRIVWTGRTQREAISQGALPFYAAAASAPAGWSGEEVR